MDICKALLANEPENKDFQIRYARILTNLGAACELSGNLEHIDEASESQLSALQMFEKLGDQQGIVNAVTGLGRIALIGSDPDKAIQQYKRAWSLLEKTGYKRAVTALSLHYAEAYLRKGETEMANPYLKRFAEGVLAGEITEHDAIILKDVFRRMASAYDSLQMAVDKFDEVRKRFEKV